MEGGSEHLGEYKGGSESLRVKGESSETSINVQQGLKHLWRRKFRSSVNVREGSERLQVWRNGRDIMALTSVA